MNKTVFWTMIGAIFIFLFVTVKTDGIKVTLEKAKNAVGISSKKDSNENKKKEFIDWNFEKIGTEEGYTKVNLLINGEKYSEDTYKGECEEKSVNLYPDEVSPYVICGEKDSFIELGVFKENEKFFLKRGIVNLGADEDYPSYRGKFITLLQII